MKITSEILEQVNEILVVNNLDFTIEKIPMLLNTGMETPYFGLLNTKTNEVINAVKGSYQISQNEEIVLAAVMGMQPFKHQLKVSKAGSINGGRRVFIQLEMIGNDVFNNDEITRYITIIDSNDGSTSLSVGIGTLTMSCQNQFWQFYKSGNKMRHTTNLVKKIKMLPSLITEALDNSLELNRKFQMMYNIKANEKLVHSLVNNLVGADRRMSTKEIEELSTRKQNQMNALYKHITREMKTKGDNLWGLHSGVTSWTTHEKSHPKRENGHIESLMMGTNQRTASQALVFLENYIKEQELITVG